MLRSDGEAGTRRYRPLRLSRFSCCCVSAPSHRIAATAAGYFHTQAQTVMALNYPVLCSIICRAFVNGSVKHLIWISSVLCVCRNVKAVNRW